jgi:hypothetical protein
MSIAGHISLPLVLPSQEISHSHQVVSRSREGESPGQPFPAAVAGFTEMTNGLQPAEDFFYPFTQPLARCVSCVSGGAAIQGRAAAFPGHMGHGPAAPELPG